MTKQQKFLVKIPKADNPEEFTEHKFATIEDIANFLEVSPNTLYSLRTGRLKMVHTTKKKLEGVQVEKIPVFYASKRNQEEINKEIVEYRKRKSETKV
jgi:hypothetical protein